MHLQLKCWKFLACLCAIICGFVTFSAVGCSVSEEIRDLARASQELDSNENFMLLSGMFFHLLAKKLPITEKIILELRWFMQANTESISNLPSFLPAFISDLEGIMENPKRLNNIIANSLEELRNDGSDVEEK